MSTIQKESENRRKRRKILFGIGGTALLGGIGFYTSNHLSNPNQKNNTNHYTPISIRVACPAHQEKPLLVVAQEKGFFQKYGINIIFIENIQNSDQALNALQNDICDAAIVSILDWLPRLISGLSAKLLIGINAGNFRLLVSRKQRIERLADFSGLKIATTPHSQEAKLFFSILLRRKGFNPEKGIQWVEMEDEELLPALLSNKVQGVIGHDPLMWKLMMTAQNKVFELAGNQSGSWRNRVNQVIGFKDSFLQNNPEITQSLRKSIQDASDWQNKHIKETSYLLADEWKDWNQKQILSMLQHQTQGVIPINNDLWEQTAQYIDEMKLLGKVSNDIKSSRLARQFCINIR